MTFEIISGNVGGAFTIGNQTGQVWVVRDVDKEVIDQYTLTILAEDGGESCCQQFHLLLVLWFSWSLLLLEYIHVPLCCC